MQSNFRILSALMRGVWFIEPSLTVGYVPAIEALLSQNTSDIDKNSRKADRLNGKSAAHTPDIMAVDDELDYENYFREKEYQYYAVEPETGFKHLQFDKVKPGSVAVIPIEDVMMRFDFCGAPGMETLEQIFVKAYNHPNISGIVAKMHTPGGSVDYLKEFTNTIKLLDKPVISLVTGYSASAGVYFMSASDAILLENNTAMVGSIGTMMTLADYTKMYELRGITVHEIYAEQSTEKNKDYKQAMSGNYKPIQTGILNPFAQDFIDTVVENRGDKLNDFDGKLLKGSTYLGDSGIETGLADGYGSLAAAIALASQKKLQVSFSVTNSINNSNTMALFSNKYKELHSLNGVEPTSITEEKLTAVNNELNENGVTAVKVVSNADLKEFETQLEAANTAKNKAEEKEKTAADALAAEKEAHNTTKAELEKLKNIDATEEAKLVADKDKNQASAELDKSDEENQPLSKFKN